MLCLRDPKLAERLGARFDSGIQKIIKFTEDGSTYSPPRPCPARDDQEAR